MISAIVYTSATGATAQYAQPLAWLAAQEG